MWVAKSPVGMSDGTVLVKSFAAGKCREAFLRND